MGQVIGILIIAALLFASLFNNSAKNKERALVKMKDYYSKSEVFDLAHEATTTAMPYYVVAGFMIGIMFASLTMKS